MQKKLSILAIALVLLATYAYSALSTSLIMTGEAVFRNVSDIRVTNITYTSVTNDAVLSYESTHKKDTITNGFVLPNANSTITYTIEVTNKGTIDQAIYDLQTQSSNNNDMVILVDNKPINQALPMIIPYQTTRNITITYKTNSPSNNVINIVNKFIFKEVYYITYNLKGGSATNDQTDLINGQIKYQDVDLVLTDQTPKKTSYVFTGWTDEQNGQAVKYNVGDTYTLNQDKTLYAVYALGESTFLDGPTFNAKIKTLAGDTLDSTNPHLTTDTNITSIVRANSLPNNFTPTEANIVSTNDSSLPIYAWFDNGTIYYYTEVSHPYMNSNGSEMFTRLTNATSIDVSTIDTSKATKINAMFYQDYSLRRIDVSNFNTSNVSDMRDMFSMYQGTSQLEEIIGLTSFDTSNVTLMGTMFYNCNNIKNLDLSSFDLTKQTNRELYLLMKVDSLKSLKTPNTIPSSTIFNLPKEMYDTSGNEYATLTSTSPTQTWIYAATIFLPGSTFNVKIRKLADSNANVSNLYDNVDNNITNIQRYTSTPNSNIISNAEIVSTSDSGLPIYAWYDNGTIYYYSKAATLYLNENASTMFTNLYKVTTIDFSTIKTNKTKYMGSLFYGNHVLTTNGLNLGNWDTSNVINMANMFQLCWSIRNLDLSSFDTSNVTSMRAMFHAMPNLETINLSSFNTSNVQSMYYMFKNNYKLSSLDISTFNMSSVTDTTDMLSGMTVLSSLKTPKVYPTDTSKTITLPTTLYGPDNTAYTTLSSTSPTETWIKQAYTVVFNANNGTGTMSNQSIGVSSTTNLTSNTYTREGYQFVGWNTQANGQGTAYLDEASVTGLANANEIITLYAQWIGIDYTVTADANGGSISATTGWTGTGNTATKQITYGDQYGTLPSPTKTGYTFSGWSKENLLDLNNYITDNRIVKITSDKIRINKIDDENTYSTGNINNENLENGKTYTISADVVGEFTGRIYAFFGSSLEDYEISNGKAFATFIYRTSTDKGGLFVRQNSGTNVDANIIGNYVELSNIWLVEGSTEFITSNSVVYTNSNHTLYAKYTPNNYSITYDKNDNGATGTMNNQSAIYDETFNLTTNAFTKEGYTFAGWNTQANGQGTAYLDGASVSNLTSTNNGNVTLYAQWIPNTYTVTFDYDGATTTGISSKQVTYDSTYGTLPEPTKTGYEFKGWNGKNLFNKNVASSNKVIVWESGKLNNEEGSVVSGFIKVTNGMSYISKYRMQVILYDENKTYIGKYNNINSHVSSFTITGNNQAAYVRISFRSSGNNLDMTTVDDLQIEEGSTATPYEPYYVTSSVNVTQAKNHTLKAIWEKKEATFDTGQNFNVKIKKLANPTLENPTHGTDDTNITSIVRANSIPSSWIVNDVVTPPSENNIVSTNDSMYPIYAWYDNGTIYYYTEALNPYMNANAHSMFMNLTNILSIDINTIDTSRTTNMNYLFYRCYHIQTLDISNFDTSNVVSMRQMFYICSSLTNINLSNFDTSNVTDMYYMFGNCIGITNLDISIFNMNKVIDATNMFNNMTSLQSLKTPNTIPSDTSVTITLPTTLYDTNGNSYSTLTSTSPTSTWLYTAPTFVSGEEFIIKVKQLANPTNDNVRIDTVDTNITSIVKANALPNGFVSSDANTVSTSDSVLPINIWYDNGTLYYYTQSSKAYMNSSASHMFRELISLTSIDMSIIDTSRTTEMYALFYGTPSLTNINLSNFDTSNVTNMAYMFANSTGLTSIDLSTFDTSNVTDVSNMFFGTTLTSLDLSSMDLSSVLYATNMLEEMSSLKEIKTPEVNPTSTTIELPMTLYDNSGTSYTSITSSTPTETWITTLTKFISGADFNTKIKQLANPSTPNISYDTVDNNITSIARANSLPNGFVASTDNTVSTSDSYNPIYIWYDNGTLYYYSASNTIYMSIYGTNMFSDLRSVTSIDVSTINTKFTTDMQWQFANDYALTTVDVSNYDGSSLVNFALMNMFYNCSSLTSLDLSNFNNTSTINTTDDMFNGCSSLTTLDLSGLDLSGVITGTNMFAGVTSLQSLKTPSSMPPVNPIYLPVTLYDQTGAIHLTLSSSSPTSVWLKVPYTVTFNKNDNSATGTMSNQEIAENVTSSLNVNTYSLRGYKFIGWNTQSDGQGTTYLDSASVRNLTTIGNTITLYAQWEKIMADNVEHENNDLNCEDTQCVIDELYYMLY